MPPFVTPERVVRLTPTANVANTARSDGLRLSMARRRPWDAVVVGGGVVGCAVLRELTVHLGWRVLLVEASPHLAAGASSGDTRPAPASHR